MHRKYLAAYIKQSGCLEFSKKGGRPKTNLRSPCIVWSMCGSIKENVNIHTWHFCKKQAWWRRNCCQASANLGQLKVKTKSLILRLTIPEDHLKSLKTNIYILSLPLSLAAPCQWFSFNGMGQVPQVTPLCM